MTDPHLHLLSRLARTAEGKILLLVLDGVGDLVSDAQSKTALETARTPNLDALAARSALGRMVPVAPGITPGSGPGHLALFGYDPRRPEVDIGRGVLEALGLDLELAAGEVAARGNFATADAGGQLTDRRAGRIPTSECHRLVARLVGHLEEHPVPGVSVRVVAGEGHRFVLILRAEAGEAPLSPHLADTDPQRLGAPPNRPRPADDAPDPDAARATADLVNTVLERFQEALAGEERANRTLLRGFSSLPHLPSFEELYHLQAGAFAAYPLYRGVARACGMEPVPVPKDLGEAVAVIEERWGDFDFVFFHVKPTDAAGEDGDLAAKVRVIEEVDALLPRLLALGPEVVAVTADHSTPAPMKAHSWHPVPLLLHGPSCFVDTARRFTERDAIPGHLGTFPARYLMGLALANAGRLGKYGA